MKDVVIGIVNKDGKILMIKRVKNEDNLIWSFPGGKIENGETKEQACIREVFEETGINVKINKILGERIHPNTQVKLTYFLCDYLNGETTILDKSEILEIAYKSKEEFYNDVKTDIYLPVSKFIKDNIK